MLALFIQNQIVELKNYPLLTYNAVSTDWLLKFINSNNENNNEKGEKIRNKNILTESLKSENL